jgi:hypothetical protein
MPTLHWIGKEAVVKQHKEVPCRLLEPVPELSLPSPGLTATLSPAGRWAGGEGLSPLLGIHEGRAIYLLYNGILKDKSVGGGDVLTNPVFEVLPKFTGPKVIYAAANRMGSRAAREGIAFKQTPYALEL